MTSVVAFADAGACWICGSGDGVRVHEAALDFTEFREQDPELAAYTGERVWIRRCRECGFAQPERLPSLDRYFDRMYDQRWSAEWIAAEFEASYKDWIFTRVLAGLERRLPMPRRTLLDIGAHVGRFLHLAQRRGWQAEGVELNPRTAAYAAERTRARVHRLNAQQLGALGCRFDAVTLIDVLEHIPRPVHLLSQLREVTTPGAWLSVKVPCGPAQQLKETVRAAVVPGYRATLANNLVHVNHFSPRSLRLAMSEAGFEAVAIEIAAPELPPAAGWRGRSSKALRLGIFFAGLAVPGGLHTPLALNLQAYARAPR
jgi:SAM-dependent methyltransferase